MVDNGTQTTDPTDELNTTEMDLESEPLVIYGMNFGSTDFHEAYRDGNFGVKRGRINFVHAKRWSQAHLTVAVLLTILSISTVVLMGSQRSYWINHDTVDFFSFITIFCGILAVVTSCCSLYLVGYLATMRRPLFVLLLVRLLCVFECMVMIAGIVTTLITVSDSHEKASYRYYDRKLKKVRVIVRQSEHYVWFVFSCVFLVIAMIVDFFTAVAWLFHWWRCCDCCQKFKSMCIFEPGQPLAEGVPDPRTGLCRECMYVCWAAYKDGCGTVI